MSDKKAGKQGRMLQKGRKNEILVVSSACLAIAAEATNRTSIFGAISGHVVHLDTDYCRNYTRIFKFASYFRIVQRT